MRTTVLSSIFTDGMTIGELLRRNYAEFNSSSQGLPSDEVQRLIELAGGFWQHSGDPKAPHAVLRSGKHSDGFIAVPTVLKYALVNAWLARSLANKLALLHPEAIKDVQWVTGSDHAAGSFSFGVAQFLTTLNPALMHDFPDKTALIEGKEVGPWLEQSAGFAVPHGLKPSEVQKWARHTIGEGEPVLQIEELCTTNLTIRRVREGLAAHHPYPITYAPVIGMVVNRTGSSTFEDTPIVSLLDVTFNEWDADACSLCQGGSEALTNVKKTTEQWNKLTLVNKAA